MDKNTNNLLPFSWAEYEKRTDKDSCVVTRDGRPVKIAGYNPEVSPAQRVAGWLGDSADSWHEDGAYLNCKDEHEDDLFLKPEAREVYVNLYTYGMGDRETDSLERAKVVGTSSALAVLRFTYEGNCLTDIAIVHRYNQNDNA